MKDSATNSSKFPSRPTTRRRIFVVSYTRWGESMFPGCYSLDYDAKLPRQGLVSIGCI